MDSSRRLSQIEPTWGNRRMSQMTTSSGGQQNKVQFSPDTKDKEKEDKKKKPCCNKKFLQFVIIMFNIIFVIFGGALLTVGAFALSDTTQYGLDGGKVLENLPTLAEAAGLNNTREAPSNKLKLDASVLSQDVGIALVVIGGVIVLLAAEGFLSVCQSDSSALMFYDVCVCILLFIQVILVIAFFVGALAGPIKGRMQAMITEDYRGIDGYNPNSILWNFMMVKLECCGVEDYEDFRKAKKWRNERVFTELGNEEVQFLWPIACCKVNDDLSGFQNMTCVYQQNTTTPDEYHIDKGCYDELGKFLGKYKINAIITIVIVFLLQFMLIVVASLLIRIMKKEKEEPDEEPEPPTKRRESMRVAPAASQNQAQLFL